jgi:hypothetical protein
MDDSGKSHLYFVNFDELVKSPNVCFSVIPAKLVPAKAGSRNLVFSNGYKFTGPRFSPEGRLFKRSSTFLFEKWYPGDQENPAEAFSKTPVRAIG